MNRIFYTLFLSALLSLNACTKIETISVACGDDKLHPNTTSISVSSGSNASVTFSDFFAIGDTLIIVRPNQTIQRLLFNANYYNGIKYNFSTSSNTNAGDYLFTHKYNKASGCKDASVTVNLKITGTVTLPCQISVSNRLYFNSVSSNLTLNSSSTGYYYNANNTAVYRLLYNGSLDVFTIYFYENAKPNPGNVYNVGASNQVGYTDEVEIYFGTTRLNQGGKLYCFLENGKTYVQLCNLKDLNANNYSAKILIP
jgi:hypothetical protein